MTMNWKVAFKLQAVFLSVYIRIYVFLYSHVYVYGTLICVCVTTHMCG